MQTVRPLPGRAVGSKARRADLRTLPPRRDRPIVKGQKELIFVLGILGISERYGAAPTPSMTSQRCSANVGQGLRQRSWQ